MSQSMWAFIHVFWYITYQWQGLVLMYSDKKVFTVHIKTERVSWPLKFPQLVGYEPLILAHRLSLTLWNRGVAYATGNKSTDLEVVVLRKKVGEMDGLMSTPLRHHHYASYLLHLGVVWRTHTVQETSNLRKDGEKYTSRHADIYIDTHTLSLSLSHTHTHIHTNTHKHTHTNIHTHTHTHTNTHTHRRCNRAHRILSYLSSKIRDDNKLFENVLWQDVRETCLFDIIWRDIDMVRSEVKVGSRYCSHSPLCLRRECSSLVIWCRRDDNLIPMFVDCSSGGRCNLTLFFCLFLDLSYLLSLLRRSTDLHAKDDVTDLRLGQRRHIHTGGRR